MHKNTLQKLTIIFIRTSSIVILHSTTQRFRNHFFWKAVRSCFVTMEKVLIYLTKCVLNHCQKYMI